MTMTEALVGAHQQSFVRAIAAADRCLDRAVRTLDARNGGYRWSTCRDHRPIDRVIVIQIDAAQFFVNEVPECEIGGDREIGGDLTLHADTQMLRLRRNE